MPGKQRNLEIKATDPEPQATLRAALEHGAYDRAELAGPKVSLYRVVSVSDHLALIGALTDALGVRCVVEKARRLLVWRNVRIHLDRVSGLGTSSTSCAGCSASPTTG